MRARLRVLFVFVSAWACASGLSGCSRGETAKLAPELATSVGSQARSLRAPESGGGSITHFQVHSVAEYFSTLGQRFVPKAARGLHAVYEFNLGTQGVYFVIVDDGTMRVERDASRRPDTVLTMNGDDYVRMANGQLDGTAAYFAGRLKVQGSLRLARRMRAIFPSGR